MIVSPPELPRIDAVSLNGRVLAFAAAVTLFTVLPARRATRIEPVAVLRAE